MLNSDFRDILSEFTNAKVEFLVVGAFAMAAHGIVRATGDIDIWIRPTRENADRVVQALIKFGAPPDLVQPDVLTQPRRVVQLGVSPVRIDLMTGISGVTWEAAWEQRVVSQLGGVEVAVLGRQHLIANKRSTRRPKDARDLELLEG